MQLHAKIKVYTLVDRCSRRGSRGLCKRYMGKASSCPQMVALTVQRPSLGGKPVCQKRLETQRSLTVSLGFFAISLGFSFAMCKGLEVELLCLIEVTPLHADLRQGCKRLAQRVVALLAATLGLSEEANGFREPPVGRVEISASAVDLSSLHRDLGPALPLLEVDALGTLSALCALGALRLLAPPGQHLVRCVEGVDCALGISLPPQDAPILQQDVHMQVTAPVRAVFAAEGDELLLQQIGGPVKSEQAGEVVCEQEAALDGLHRQGSCLQSWLRRHHRRLRQRLSLCRRRLRWLGPLISRVCGAVNDRDLL
mmetsp:Transcript_77/g.264  ORF Transcript_77/g.264 Transcript_77/m.264 type:complete len:312 (+) Transcript_77:218-1153(+)